MGAKTGNKRAGEGNVGSEAWQLLFRLLQEDKGAVQAVWEEFELTPAQAHLLQCLESNTPIPMVGLADALQCKASNVTGLVDKLESRGLIQRTVDAQDRRVKAIVLTAAGQRFRAKLLERLAVPPPFIDQLSADDQQTLFGILRRAASRRQQLSNPS
jgi:MarR family transcriptional regulator, organic hydroperoxide resistance regulator